MRFKEAHIFGFGRWVDETVTLDKRNGLQSFYGENESGKSTLQQFLLYMLFDLPPRLRKFYQPKTSSQFGGQLVIEDDEVGIYTIERTAEQLVCLLADGRREGKSWLENQLDGLTRSTYDSVYSFSAEQLETIRQMKASELSEVLFSVGISGATVVYDTEKTLQKSLDDLFKPLGSKPALNRQVKKVADLEKSLKEAQAQEASYPQWLEEKAAYEEQIMTCKHTIEDLQMKQLFYKQMERIIPDLQAYLKHAAVMEQIDSNDRFPKQGIPRYEQLKGDLITPKASYEHVTQRIKGIDDELSEKERELVDSHLYAAAKQLVHQKDQYEQLQEAIQKMHIEKTWLEDEIQESANEMDMPVAIIKDNRYPLSLQQEWMAIGNEQARINKEKQRLQAEQQAWMEEQYHLNEQIEQIEVQLYPDATFREMQEQLTLDDNEKNYAKQQASWTQFKESRHKLAKNTLLSFSVIGIIGAGLSYLLEQTTFLVLSFLLIALGLGLYVFLKRTNRQLQMMIEQPNMKMAPLAPEDREMIEASIAKQLAYIEELDRHQLAAQDLEKRMTANKYQLKQMNLDRQQLNGKLEKERQTYPILEGLQAAHWPALLETIHQVKSLLSKEEKQLAHESLLREELNEWSRELEKFKHILYVKENENITIHMLENWLDVYERKRIEIRKLTEERQNLLEEKNHLQETITYIHGEMDALFTLANVVDEETYYERAERFDMQERSKQIVLQFEQYMIQAFTKEQREMMMNEPWSEEKIKHALDKIYRDIQEAEDKKQVYQHRLAEKNVVLNEQEQSDLLASLTLEYEVEKALLNELAEKWLVDKVAYDVLQETKMRYHEKYMAQITQKLTSYFSQMTNGKYVHVYAPIDQTTFIVETTDGMRFDVTQLSKGTIDQLYIALRLAIGIVMSEKYNVPFIMDDAFVHFDGIRTKRTVDVIKKIAKDKQVILFTCHNHIATLTNAVSVRERSSLMA